MNIEAACKTVLVIEDDDSIRESLTFLLEMEGYIVTTAENGQKGMEALSLVQPCLILLDLMMPVMDGWEFLSALRAGNQERVAHVPVIITSASGQAADTATQQAQGLIRKPIDFDTLMATVQRFCVGSSD